MPRVNLQPLLVGDGCTKKIIVDWFLMILTNPRKVLKENLVEVNREGGGYGLLD
jgi:hypothetical protein